jgi:hypothetical protein
MTRASQFRIMASFVAFVAIVLAGLGVFFQSYLKDDVELTTRTALDADWGSAIGYLRIDHQRPMWVYDRNDPDEAYSVERLRRVYLLADESGAPLEHSTIYESIGVSTPRTHAPEYRLQRDKNGVPYMIRTGWIRDDQARRYFLAIGRSLAVPYRTANQFMLTYLAISLLTLALAGLFGWWMTRIVERGRALPT